MLIARYNTIYRCDLNVAELRSALLPASRPGRVVNVSRTVENGWVLIANVVSPVRYETAPFRGTPVCVSENRRTTCVHDVGFGCVEILSFPISCPNPRPTGPLWLVCIVGRRFVWPASFTYARKYFHNGTTPNKSPLRTRDTVRATEVFTPDACTRYGPSAVWTAGGWRWEGERLIGDIERGVDFFFFYSPFSRTASRLRSDSEKSARVRARIEYQHTYARETTDWPSSAVYSGKPPARVPGTVLHIQYVRGTNGKVNPCGYFQGLFSRSKSLITPRNTQCFITKCLCIQNTVWNTRFMVEFSIFGFVKKLSNTTRIKRNINVFT